MLILLSITIWINSREMFCILVFSCFSFNIFWGRCTVPVQKRGCFYLCFTALCPCVLLALRPFNTYYFFIFTSFSKKSNIWVGNLRLFSIIAHLRTRIHMILPPKTGGSKGWKKKCPIQKWLPSNCWMYSVRIITP